MRQIYYNKIYNKWLDPLVKDSDNSPGCKNVQQPR